MLNGETIADNDVEQRPNYVGIAIAVILVIVIVILTVVLTRNGFNFGSTAKSDNNVAIVNENEQAMLAGTITYSGLTPDTDDPEQVKIIIRPANSDEEFTDTGIRFGVGESRSWSYPAAVAGQNYEVQAILLQSGRAIAKSNLEQVTAPALNIILDFNLSWDDLGYTLETAPTQDISGHVTINGYLPAGASIEIIEVVGKTANQWLTLAATSNQLTFTLHEMAVSDNYILSANLLDKNGTKIGTSSQSVLADVGDTAVDFVINSTAQAPATPTPTPVPSQTVTATPTPATGAKMTGSVTLNGPLDANSRLLILGKRPQDSDYTVWQTINSPSNNGQYWEYDGATAGTTYNVQVALQVNNNNVATGIPITTVAPATNLNFTLNTGLSLPAPSGQAYADPCQRDGNNWKTIIKVPAVAGAAQYLVQIGTKEGYSDRYNQIVPADGNNEVKFTVGGFNTGEKNYLRYAYSYCAGCTNSSNFSGWDVTYSFTCE